ncbi:Putative P-loop containing nucleoside triphosphate hydrolase [Septoria linicola]|uniref:P-loop containing nucleoside triphosphate hydrolase n=1 Tax=Septoria linicola TaxID=215465 RepID=A0A9Q9ER73_9PEZI|nr:putative P-loop containing nucleoside triphosphate hydrolase [Septoria linicola]USW59594.1 Putative P-loop containing nucleoside triphosphate hydrolase [Septoria linicola]
MQRYTSRGNRSAECQNRRHVTLFEFLTEWDFSTFKKRPRAKPRIINYFPKYSSTEGDDTYVDWCHVKIVLHRPFMVGPTLPYTSEEHLDLVSVGSTVDEHLRPLLHTIWASAYNHCYANHNYHPYDYFGIDLPEPGQDEFEDEHHDPEVERPEAELLAAALPDRNPAEMEEDGDDLGNRQLDREYDWKRFHVGSFSIAEDDVKDWWKNIRGTTSIVQSIGHPGPNWAQKLAGLAPAQTLLHTRMVAHWRQMLFGIADPAPLLLHLDGRAGTGKSHMIEMISSQFELLTDSFNQANGLLVGSGRLKNVVLRLAPTGAAAYGIKGMTLHTALRLPIHMKEYVPLAGTGLAEFKTLIHDIIYLIIDGKSMINLTMMHWIE